MPLDAMSPSILKRFDNLDEGRTMTKGRFELVTSLLFAESLRRGLSHLGIAVVQRPR